MAPLPPGPVPPGPIPPGPIPPGPIPPGPIPPIAAPPGPGPAPVLGYDSAHKSSSDACEKRLVELGMEQGPKTMVPKTSPSAIGSDFKVQTNVFGLQLTKDTIVHSYLVHAAVDLTPTKSAVFTKKGNEDFVVLDRHEKCIQIFYKVVEFNPDFFQLAENNQLIYDGQNQLFTTVDLFPNISNKEDKKALFQIDGSDLNNKDMENLKGITLEVYVGDRHRIRFSRENLVERTADSDLNVNDRSLTQFLELVVNQKCIRDTKRFACFEHGKVYVLNPTEEGYAPKDTMPVGDGKYLLPGMKKSIYFIEGPFGPGHNNPSLVVDSMKAPFHKEQPFHEKMEDIMFPKFGRHENAPPNDVNRLFPNFEKATHIVKGLDVYSKYTGRIRHLKIEAIHHLNAVKALFDLGDGQTVSVFQYFRDKYDIILKFPHLNLLVCKDRGNKNFFPMELMTVSPKQRVKISQLTTLQSQATVKECAVKPFDRQRMIMGALKASALHPDEEERNKLLHVLGLKLYHDPLLCNGKLLNELKVTYGKDHNVDVQKGQWKSGNEFYRPAFGPKVWAVYAVNGGGRQGITNQHVIKFAERFVKEAGNRGLKFPRPAEMEVVPYGEVEVKIRFAAKNDCDYILMVTDNGIVDLHTQYKKWERELGVIIQDMQTKNLLAINEQNKFRTLENILNKTNMKFGGVNYVVQDRTVTEDQLVVGVGQSMPAPLLLPMKSGKGYLSPTIIGYCSNARASQEFVGDFTLSTQSQDTMASMEEIIDNLLTIWTNKRERKSELKRIVLYRTATAEGSYGAILALEIPLIRAVIKKHGMDAKLIYIMVSKDHTFRLFKDDGGSSSGSSGTATAPTVSRHSVNYSSFNNDPNIPAGVLVDTEITHPSFKQFFLNAHRTLQGTAKTPMYTILADDFNAPMDKLETLTFTLCHHHQIVSLATSLPAPLYIANEYAKRGRALWTLKTAGCPIPADNNGNDKAKLSAMTKEMAYKDTKFEKLRVNA